MERHCALDAWQYAETQTQLTLLSLHLNAMQSLLKTSQSLCYNPCDYLPSNLYTSISMYIDASYF